MIFRYLIIYIAIIFSLNYVTAQPIQVKEIPTGNHHHFEALDQFFFFHNDSLWKSDGTTAGTKFLKDLQTSEFFFPINFNVYEINTVFFFFINENLYRSNGTGSGTEIVANYDLVTPLGVMNNEFYYGALKNGTYRLYKVATGAPVSLKQLQTVFNPAGPAILDDYLYFVGQTDEFTSWLWRTNGTSSGTTKITKILDFDSPQHELKVVNNTIFIIQQYNTYQLWKSDGTDAGTTLLRDFSDGIIKDPTSYKNKLYFINEGSGFPGLYVSDGTENGTRLLKNFQGSVGATIAGQAKDQLIITTLIDGDSSLIYRSDGTTEGTLPIHYFGNAYSLNDFTFMDNIFFYINRQLPGFGNYELMQSGLTAFNTESVQQLFPALNLSNPGNLTNVNDMLYFTTLNTSTNEAELWKYNALAPANPVPFFSLINATTDEENLWLRNDDTIVKYTGEQINIRYTPATLKTESVKFILNGASRRIENESPYALAGDNNRDYNSWLPSSPGKYILTAQEYSQNNASGVLLASTTITIYITTVNPGKAPIVAAGSDKTLTLPFSSLKLTGTASDVDGNITSVSWSLVGFPDFQVVDSVLISNPAEISTNVSGLTIPGEYRFRLAITDNSGLTSYDELVVTVQGQIIINISLVESDFIFTQLNNGDILYLNGRKYNIVASPFPYETGSVKFIYDDITRVENRPPYALFGDLEGDLKEEIITPGTHTLTIIPYSGSNATGSQGIPKTITFTVIDPNARISGNSLAKSQRLCYPNPSSDHFTINIPVSSKSSVNVDVFDATGVHIDKLFEGKIQEPADLELFWESTGKGIYLLKIRMNDEVFTEKLIVN